MNFSLDLVWLISSIDTADTCIGKKHPKMLECYFFSVEICWPKNWYLWAKILRCNYRSFFLDYFCNNTILEDAKSIPLCLDALYSVWGKRIYMRLLAKEDAWNIVSFFIYFSCRICMLMAILLLLYYLKITWKDLYFRYFF